MSYSLVTRKIPKGVKPIHFHFESDPEFGMLNLCCWENEIDKIENFNKKIINNNEIRIHFPMFEYFYVEKYSLKKGFNFRQLLIELLEQDYKQENMIQL